MKTAAISGLSFDGSHIAALINDEPLGYGDGLNMYAYAGNDPVNNSDPSGLKHRVFRGVFRGQCSDLGKTGGLG